MTPIQTAHAWAKTHCGSRRPVFSPGSFATFAASRTAACWGQPRGGTLLGKGLKIAVCQPSPRHKGDPCVFLYDFKKI